MHAPLLTRLAALLAPVLLTSVLLSGCNETTPAAQAAPKKPLSIGIVQIVEHEALDDAVKGFVERLDELGYREGVEVTLDRQNAQGDQATLAAITGRFVSNDVDLIYAVSTPAVQAAARATRTIPIVATAVTSFERAKVVKTNSHPGGNVTGVSNIGPIAEQLELLLKLTGGKKDVGVLYNPAEDNSLFQVEVLRERARELGVSVREVAVTSVNDIQQVVASLRGKVAGLWIPTDNVIASGSAILAKSAADAGLPVVTGDLVFVQGGCLATVTISHHTLGRMTAERAVEILEGKKKPGDIPVARQETSRIVMNRKALALLGEKAPAGLPIDWIE